MSAAFTAVKQLRHLFLKKRNSLPNNELQIDSEIKNCQPNNENQIRGLGNGNSGTVAGKCVAIVLLPNLVIIKVDDKVAVAVGPVIGVQHRLPQCVLPHRIVIGLNNSIKVIISRIAWRIHRVRFDEIISQNGRYC